MKYILASLLFAFSMLTQSAEAQPLGTKPALQGVQSLIPKVLDALAARDFTTLSSFVGEEGLTVSPYVMLDDIDVTLSRADVRLCAANSEMWLWGEEDGSGEPIEATCSQYFDKFVWNADYRKADEILYNEPRQRGNETNNNHDFAPDAIVVELHIHGTAAMGGMDWKSLRLIFRDGDKGLSLIAITRDVWTI